MSFAGLVPSFRLDVLLLAAGFLFHTSYVLVHMHMCMYAYVFYVTQPESTNLRPPHQQSCNTTAQPPPNSSAALVP